MSVWGRAREGRLTAVIGAVPAAPADLEVLRCRCSSGLAGWMPLEAQLGLSGQGLIEGLRAPPSKRLLGDVTPPEPTDALLDALRSASGSRALLLSQVDRASADLEPVIAALIEAGDVPVVLVANTITPPVERVRDRHGNAALVEHGAPQTPLAALPTDVLQVLVAAAAHEGPIELSALASLCHRPADAVLASLQGAVVRGVPIEDDGEGRFAIDADTLLEVRGVTLPTWARQLASEDRPSPAAAPSDLELGRLAVAIGAWDAAARLLGAAGPEAHLERVALSWARGELEHARDALQSGSADPACTVGVLWDLGDLDEAGRLAGRESGVEAALETVAIDIRRGALEAARAKLDVLLGQTSGETRCTALHLSGVLALEEPEADLARARMQLAEALSLQQDSGEEARLMETEARLALRSGNALRAASGFREALPLLFASGQAVATARATAGLARATDLSGEPTEVLEWLDRAMRMNRARPRGLVWCRAALQSLMERVPVEGRATSLTDLRRMSLELAAHVAQFRQLPDVGSL